MFAEIRDAVRPAIVMLAGFTLILGLAYPAAITGIAGLVLPGQAGGSLVRNGGKVIGSALIAQDFADARYFHPRPSAAGKGYDAAASSASNLAPGSKDLADRIAASIDSLHKEGATTPIPGDLVTTSGSGLDPDISPAAARLQVARVAAARGLPAAQVTALVDAAVAAPLLGFIGEPRVNVLALNRSLGRSLDRAGAPAPAAL